MMFVRQAFATPHPDACWDDWLGCYLETDDALRGRIQRYYNERDQRPEAASVRGRAAPEVARGVTHALE